MRKRVAALSLFLLAILTHESQGWTWKRVAPGTTLLLNRLAFRDSISVFATADRSVHGNANGNSSSLFRSDTGGINWIRRSSYSGSVTALTFLDPDTGLMFSFVDESMGTRLFRTTNRGESWSTNRLFRGSLVYSGSFSDHATGLAVGYQNNGGVRGTFIVRTEDAGLNWETVHMSGYVPEVGVYGGPSLLIRHSGPQDVLVAGFKGFVLRSSDGGQTWDSIPSPGVPTNPVELSFPSPDTGFIANHNGIFRTTDRGTTWQNVYPVRTTSLCFRDFRFGIAGDKDGRLLKTTNGGGTWDTLAFLHAPLYAIAMKGNRAAATGVRGLSIFSTDVAGDRWFFSRESSQGGLHAVATFGMHEAVAVGDYGVINVTSDTGKTWSNYGARGSYHLAMAYSRTRGAFVVGYGGDGTLHRVAAGVVTTVTSGTTNDMNAIAFAGDTGLAVGNSGAIIRTIDAGITWGPVVSGTSSSQLAVAWASPLKAYSAGVNGTLLTSQNAGATWSPVSTGKNVVWRGAAFADANLGLVVGDSGQILRTTNGGSAWTSSYIGQSGALMSVAFLNNREAIVSDVSGNIWSTYDGGVSWMSDAVLRDSLSLYTLWLNSVQSDHEGSGTRFYFPSVAVSKGGIAYAAGTYGAIYQGRPSPPATVSLRYPEYGEKEQSLSPTLRWNRGAGAGAYRLEISEQSDFSVLTVNDTGLTDTVRVVGPLSPGVRYYWRVRGANSAGTSSSFNAYYFETATIPPTPMTPGPLASEVTLSPAFRWQPLAGSPTYHLQVSEDSTFSAAFLRDSTLATSFRVVGPLKFSTTYFWRVSGKTSLGTVSGWSELRRFRTTASTRSPDADTGLKSLSSNLTGDLYGLSFGNAGVGLAVASDGKITRSTDTGETWIQTASPVSTALRGVSFLGDSIAVVAGNGGNIHRTTDGGFTWSPNLGPGTIQLNSIAAQGFGVALAVGNSGSVARSTNGGLSWTQTSPVTTNLNAVGFGSASLALAVGSSGVVLRTTDAGATWTSVNSGTTTGLNHVVFASPEIAIGVGSTGIIRRSADSGKTWSAVASPVSQGLQEAHFLDANRGIAVGNSGTLIRTGDGGLTWSIVPAGTTGAIYSAYSADRSRIWISGAAGWLARFGSSRSPGSPSAVVLDQPGDSLNGSAVSLTMRWRLSSETIYYRLQVSSDSGFTSLQLDTSLTDTAFLAGPFALNSRYYWRVKARNFSVETPWSPVRSFKTLPPLPSTPVLSSPAEAAVGVAVPSPLRWLKNSVAGSSHLQIATDSIFSKIKLDTAALPDTSYNAWQLDYLTSYFWRVRGTNAAGTGAWASFRRFTTAIPPPGPVTTLFPFNGMQGLGTSAAFLWNKPVRAASHQLQLALDSGFVHLARDTSGLADTLLSLDSLVPDTTHYWRVRSLNATGAGSWSAIASFVTANPSTLQDGRRFAFSLSGFGGGLLRYSLPIACDVSLEVYDPGGKVVWRYQQRNQSAGQHAVKPGRIFSEGYYIAVFRAGPYSVTRRLAWLR